MLKRGISPPKNLSFLKQIIPKQQSLWEHAEQNSNIMLWEKGFLYLNAIWSDLNPILTTAFLWKVQTCAFASTPEK